MARMSNTPVQFNRTTRPHIVNRMTSGRAGECMIIDYAQLYRGDSASGRVMVQAELAEMPRPLLNGVMANVQAWFVPKSAHPRFEGHTDFVPAWRGADIETIGGPRTHPPFFVLISAAHDL